MTKKEVIQKAYGEHWEVVKDHIDENGWINNNDCDSIDFENLLEIYEDPEYGFNAEVIGCKKWIPKSIMRIENNNGWIKIESEDDLPKKSFNTYHVFSNENIFCEEPKNQGIEYFWTNDDKLKNEWLEKYTHYQPIIKPEPPIY